MKTLLADDHPLMREGVRQVLSGNLYVPDCLSETHAGPNTPAPAEFNALQLGSLTARLMEVARLLGHGFANRAIGSMLGMTESTVKVHVAAIFRALNVGNLAEAVVAMQRLTQTP